MLFGESPIRFGVRNVDLTGSPLFLSPWHGGVFTNCIPHKSCPLNCSQRVSMSALAISVCERIIVVTARVLSLMEIEDAPAPSALHSFKAHVENGKILVTADPANTVKSNMSRQPKLQTKSLSGAGVVIVGGGSATFQTVESLREVRPAYSTLVN